MLTGSPCQTPFVARTLFRSSPLAKSLKQAMHGQEAFKKSSQEVCSEHSTGELCWWTKKLAFVVSWAFFYFCEFSFAREASIKPKGEYVMIITYQTASRRVNKFSSHEVVSFAVVFFGMSRNALCHLKNSRNKQEPLIVLLWTMGARYRPGASLLWTLPILCTPEQVQRRFH